MNPVVQAIECGSADREVLRAALLLRGEGQAELFALARRRREEAFPERKVEVRSVIEVSNICRQRCAYCAIGSCAEKEQYTIACDDLLDMAAHLYGDKGRRVLLLQSGERGDAAFVDHVAGCLQRLTARYPDLVPILCLGNLTRDQYRALRDAGGRRYVLKFETSNPALYERLKPRDTLARRLQCIEDLCELGFQVGSGNMVGLPGQSLDDMAADIELLARLPLAMNSCTPFIPSEGSRLHDAPIGDADLALNTMALARCLHSDRLMPTTSSLERVRPDGQYLGLLAGANTVTIHDGTPERLQHLFPIYSAKRFAPRDGHLRSAVERAGLRFSEGAIR
jgi:biotin synthase